MKQLKYVITIVLLVSVAACSVNEDNFPIPLDEVLGTTGAYLRVLSVESAGFDILDLDNAAYIFEGEVFDEQNGDLLQNVEFFVNYTSADGSSVPETSSPIKVYDRSDFTPGEKGLPKSTFNISISEVLSALGLSSDDLLIGDRFQLRWKVNLTDGKSFTRGDASPEVEGGTFFRSPYLANVNVVAAIPEDRFVGSYTLTQNNPGVFGLVYTTETFQVDLSVDPNNTLNGRTFEAEYLGSLGFGVGPKTHRIAISLANNTDNNSVTLVEDVYAGLGCSALGLYVGGERENISDFDVNDDSQFTLGVTDNTQGDCSAGSVPVTFTATKN